jgi:hypothetical protein
MNKLITFLTASVFAFAGGNALAADAAKDAGPAKKVEKSEKAAAKPEKPAAVTQEAWDKMSDVDKKKAVEKAAKDTAKDKGATKGAEKTAAAPKKEKKGGC